MSVARDATPPVEFDAARAAAYRTGRSGAADESLTIDVDGDADSNHYVLARRIVAAGRVPSADVAAMDGYAVAGRGPWDLMGASLAGDTAPVSTIRPGQAVVIATGAVLPRGADAVIRHEDVAGEWPPTTTSIHAPGTPRTGNIRRAGEELEPGTPIGEKGQTVSAALRGLAAAAGLDSLAVIRPPRIAVIATGTELTSSGPAGPGRARDAITPILRQLIPRAGAALTGVEWVPDDADVLERRLRAAAASADVVVTTGMASHGPADHVRDVLAGLGATAIVPGVRMRPGGPQSLHALTGGAVVVSLPGNPLAAVAGFHTLIAPLVRGLLGAELPPLAASTLHEPPSAHPTATMMVPVALDAAGRLVPAGWGRSAQLRGLARQGLLAVIEPSGRRATGEPVSVRLLREG